MDATIRLTNDKISRGTKLGLERARARGVKLGNKTNLREAQRKGAATNKQAAKHRLDAFGKAVSDARRLGASTEKDIAQRLNESGFLTARDGEWTAGNVHRTLRKLSEAERAGGEASTVEPAPIADANRKLTPDGVERVRKAMIAKGLKPGTTGKVMAEMGFNRYDTTIDLRGRYPLNEKHLRALEKWLADVGAAR